MAAALAEPKAVAGPTLTDAEHARLLELEATIDRGLATWVAVGQALLEVRDRKLWRATDASWGDYLRRRWDLSLSRAQQITTVAEVAGAIVASGGEAPEASGHALLQFGPQLRDQGPEKVAETYESVRREHGPRPSGSKVRRAVADAGTKPYASQRGRHTSLSNVADALTTARTRIARLRDELNGQPLGQEARVEARNVAGVARGVVRELEELSGGPGLREREARSQPMPAHPAPPPLPGPSPYRAMQEEEDAMAATTAGEEA